MRAYVLGDPNDDKTTLGPIAQPWHVKELEAFVADAKAKGAKVVVGGESCAVDGKGRFFEATLLRDVPQTADVMQKESFGPILAVAAVDSDEEALARMNDSRLGLTASVWTKDRDRADRLARAARVRHGLHEPLRRARPGAAVDGREGLGPRRHAERARLRRAHAPEGDPLPAEVLASLSRSPRGERDRRGSGRRRRRPSSLFIVLRRVG